MGGSLGKIVFAESSRTHCGRIALAAEVLGNSGDVAVIIHEFAMKGPSGALI